MTRKKYAIFGFFQCISDYFISFWTYLASAGRKSPFFLRISVYKSAEVHTFDTKNQKQKAQNRTLFPISYDGKAAA